jgi:SAM-dependent methyltransferase
MDIAEDRMWWYRALHHRLIAALGTAVSGRVLDAGCGTGGLLAALRAARPDLEAIGLDWSEGAAHRAARKSGVPIVRGSINALPFAAASFDAAIAADVLSHAAVDPAAALLELHRVLRPRGVLVVNMPAYRWLLSAHDRQVRNARRQNAPALRASLLAAGFTTVDARYWNTLLLPAMIARRKLPGLRSANSDVAVFSPWVDLIFYAITECERRLKLPMPAGGSVLAVAARP